MYDERLDAIYMKLDSSRDPLMFEVLDAGAPDGMKIIPMSRLDYINYKAYGFIIGNINISQGWVDLIAGASHPKGHGHIITPD